MEGNFDHDGLIFSPVKYVRLFFGVFMSFITQERYIINNR